MDIPRAMFYVRGMTSTNPSAFSDVELLANLRGLRAERRRIDAREIALLVEVEARRLDARSACPSLYEFCRRVLEMSTAGAFRRVIAVKLARRFPRLLQELSANRITLSTMVLLDGHVTGQNFDALLDAVACKTTAEVEALLLERRPKPDVPARVSRVEEQAPLLSSVGSAGVPMPGNATLQPLGEERYALQVTISKRLHEQIELARDLLGHRHPDRDLAAALEQAFELLVAKLRKERLGDAARPRTTSRTAKASGVSRASLREVVARDGIGCTYRDAAGNVCGSRVRLEVDHVEARALGGRNVPDNLRIYCRAHNQLHAVEDFGEERVARRIREQRRVAVRSGLVKMGFSAKQADGAVSRLTYEQGDQATPLPELVREALLLLTAA
ncbi:MAG: hypothetical protein JWP97_2036 [Labilithrix sp.]|nr:hypothetical protein [Labilithrix sp.]